MRIVLDTNVIISATLIRGGIEDRLIRAWQHGAFDLVLSRPILEELGRAFLYERLRKRRWMTEDDVLCLLESLAEESVLVSGKTRVKASRDPDDDTFLTAALEGKADYVVSGDKNLLTLRSYQQVEILAPAQFLRVLTKKPE